MSPTTARRPPSAILVLVALALVGACGGGTGSGPILPAPSSSSATAPATARAPASEAPSAAPAVGPSAEPAPAGWVDHELAGLGVTIALPPRFEVISQDALQDPSFEAALRERYPDNPTVDLILRQLKTGNVVMVAYDFTDGATVDGLGTQVTVGKYPKPIADLSTFPDLVLSALRTQINILGEPSVDEVQLAIGPAARIQLTHRFKGSAASHDLLAIQYLIPNAGRSFFLSIASIETSGEIITEFDIAARTAHATP